MDAFDEEDNDGFGSRFNDGFGEEGEEEEGFSFYDDVVIEGEEEGFASDFYKAGSDWSCLLEEVEEEIITPESKKMKQADLFQVWGLQKSTPPQTKKKTKTTKQTDLFQVWGLQKPSLSTTSPSSSSSSKKTTTTASGKRLRESSPWATDTPPRQCPFYKKLPGLFTLLPHSFAQVCFSLCQSV